MSRFLSILSVGAGLTLVFFFLLSLINTTPTYAAPELARVPFAVTAPFDAPDAVPGDGVCDDGGGACTLRAAVMEANALPGLDMISLPPGLFTLTIAGPGEDGAATGDLDIICSAPCPGPGDGLMIAGAGMGVTIIDATPLGDRVFHILAAPAPPPYTVDMMDLTITGGAAPPPGPGPIGGGILNDGVLTLRRVSVERNVADSGGGIYDAGSTTLIDSRVVTNTAGVFDGGGIFNTAGPLTLRRTLMVNNSALVLGGGIYNTGTPVLIASSTLRSNSTFGGGGATEGGGGISHLFAGVLAIHDSTLNRNMTPGMLGGGGLLSGAGTFTTIISSTISNNSATAAGGGPGVGGGIRADGPLSMAHSAVLSNAADVSGGGAYIDNSTAIVNSTFNGNVIGTGDGHAIYTASSSTYVTHTTIAFNGPPVAGTTGALASVSVLSVSGSVVALNTPNNCSTTATSVTSNDYNLEDTGGPPATCGFALTGDAVGASLLGPLALNSGPTLNHLPGAGSLAIDTAAPPVLAANGPERLVVLCPPPGDDQRFAARPAGPRCDKGSVEAPAPPTAVDLQRATATTGQAIVPAMVLIFTALGTFFFWRRRRALMP